MLRFTVVVIVALTVQNNIMLAESLFPPLYYGGGYITYKGRHLGPDDAFKIINLAMVTACKKVISNKKADIAIDLIGQGLEFHAPDGVLPEYLPLPVPAGRDKQLELCKELNSKQKLIASYATYKGHRLTAVDGFQILDKTTLGACKEVISNPEADFLKSLQSQGLQFHKADGSKATQLSLPVPKRRTDQVEICTSLIAVTKHVTVRYRIV